jgi:hypothetical protein
MGACDSTNKKIVDSRQFFGFADNLNTNPNTNNGSSNKIKLEFTILNCSNGEKYQVSAQFLGSSRQTFMTETVTSHQNLITFNSCYICEFCFERQQDMSIIIKKSGLLIGSINTFLGKIIGSKNSTLEYNVPGHKEKIVISAYGLGNCDSLVRFNFLIKSNQKIDFGKINNKISYIITSNGRKVYSSESISKYGQLRPANIPEALIQPQFDISFLNCSQERIVSKTETINSFTGNNQGIYLSLRVNNNDYTIINQSQLLRQYSFIDYIKNGVQLGLSIGIDFTSSNGQINSPNSLHHISGSSFNDYEQAIKSCGIIVAYYDYDQLFPVYGFGAVVDNTNKPNMCFNINFQQNPEIYTIDNVIQEYRKCLQRIILAGPTEFCPMIRKAIQNIKRENNVLKYQVLMILTDGVIVDQRDTIDAVIEASFLPLSIIIIGIGNDHFQEMIELDGDKTPLISSNGTKILRDIVQFVPFNRFRNNPDLLAAQVLEEIPKQIVEYYTLKGIYPNELAQATMRTNTLMNNNNLGNY